MHIFVASSGRCGTKYLSEVFNALTDVPAFHEPLPYFTSEVLEDINDADALPVRAQKQLAEKVSLVRLRTKNGFYMESNQQFIKAYAKTVLNNFDDVGCIYLWRNPIDVAVSYAGKCRNFENDWFLQPHWKQNILRSTHPMSFYEAIIWQWYEVRERYYKLKPKFKKTFELPFTELNSLITLCKMFKHFGIEVNKNANLDSLEKNENIALGLVPIDHMLANMRDNWTRPGRRRFTYDLQEIPLGGGQ